MLWQLTARAECCKMSVVPEYYEHRLLVPALFPDAVLLSILLLFCLHSGTPVVSI